MPTVFIEENSWLSC